jgi:uncharacterized membrane protein YeaQ/YmgE (transglycosylase-associated protein family)
MSEGPRGASSVQTRSPWGWLTILLVSFLGSFVAGGIIVGLNWRRMGKQFLMLPTVIVSTVGWVLVFSVWDMLFIPSVVATTFGYIVNIAVAWLLWSWQKREYNEWKNLNPNAQRAGWMVPLAATLFSIGVYFIVL